MEGWMWISLVIGFFWLWSWISDLIEAHKAKEKERVYEEWPDKENTIAFLQQETKRVEKYEKKLGNPKDFEYEIQSETFRKTIAQHMAKCPKCETGYIRERRGRYGKFFGCSNYPTCDYTQRITNIASQVKKRVNKNAKESFIDDFLQLLKQYDV